MLVSVSAVMMNICFVCVFVGVIYHGSRAVPGTADVVHKLKQLVRRLGLE